MNSALPAANVLSVLRAATGEAHQQMEDAVGIERRIGDPAAYRQLLAVFLGFYRPLEARLAGLQGWTQGGIDLIARRKTHWIEADLSALSLTAPTIAALPNCAELPLVGDSLERGFGCLYVLEGATLGGRHITAALQNSPIPTAARRFFASYGPETGTRWREFLAALESRAGANQSEIVLAARETFTCLHRWFVRQCQGYEQSPG